MNGLIVGIIAGAVGMGYFIYGKRRAKLTPLLAGVLLCIYPYFTDSLLWLSVIGLALVAAPFLVDF
ncbi:MAG TPA: amino acid transport protein [Casimicrobiaceae bacterium]|nr:amino acid transport protein [Casimicrobiaceae bacterium]